MPPTPLQSFAHTKGLTFYLDTSAVFPMTLVLAAPADVEPRERARSNMLTSFLEQAMKAGSRAVCSVLVLEEIAAVVRNKARTAAGADPTTVHALMLKMLEHAINALRTAGVAVEQPVVTDAADAGQRLRKAHRAFLRSYPKIDSMDALHLAFGGLLSCTHFVSFDQAWTDVTEIKLLN
jgi:predicted nucleic acid-binding protein